MTLTGRGSGSPVTLNLANGVLRVLQVILSAAVVGVYATEAHNKNWQGVWRSKITLGLAAGSMSIATGLIFAIIPFLVSYFYVAILSLWDWILFFIWTALFAFMHSALPDKGWVKLCAQNVGHDPCYKMYNIQWVDLAVMILFLVTAIMGPVCLLMDRKSLFASRAYV